MDFNLSEPEKMLKAAARDFAVKSVLPIAADIDRDNQFPFELTREMGRLGYRGLPYPGKYGGGNASYTGYTLVLEQIGQASMTVAAIVHINSVAEEAVFRGYLLSRALVLIPNRILAIPFALLVSSIFFGLLHLPAGTGMFVVSSFGGLCCTVLVLWRRDLTSAIVAHTLFNIQGWYLG